MLAHLRMEAYPAYRRTMYPGSLAKDAGKLSIEENEKAIAAAKRQINLSQ